VGVQDYGVDKIFWLDEPVTELPQKNIVYLARCTIKNAYTIASKPTPYTAASSPIGTIVSSIEHTPT
jgi:hypothetical protein